MWHPTLPDEAAGSRSGYLAFTGFIHLPKQLDRFQQRGVRRRNPELEGVQHGWTVLANLRVLMAHLVEEVAVERLNQTFGFLDRGCEPVPAEDGLKRLAQVRLGVVRGD